MSFIDSLNKLLGDPNEKELKKLRRRVPRIREIQASQELQSLTLDDLPKKTEELKKRNESGESLEALLPDAFALVCRACELLRGASVKIGEQELVWDMVPFDVQLIGGMVLHDGNIAEMKTGEGKTLVCTMSVFLNALTGKGVHVITVNDYLARRDAMWMGMLYEALGLTVGTVVHGIDTQERRDAYNCDITYGTNNEFGFDYLRDNMAPSIDHQVQRPLHYAIVDEVDSILIDEARTPLIISQPAEESTTKYSQYAQLVRNLQENTHYNKDEKQRTAALTDDGVKYMEELLGVENIYTDQGFEAVHHIEQALRAHAIYENDVDYVVKDGTIVIVDEFTGRLMPGRRFGHGLHQAIEAKEGVEVQRESKTLATITFQNYFRLYEKLAGMTGTAKTEEEEFESIYGLRVIVVPTNKPTIRNDKSDAIYRTIQAKFTAVASVAKEKNTKGQPILIGTTSIEKSEAMSELLQKEGVPHEVLNAKHHEKEAAIVAKAGQKGSVTIATNMAGRGTDIKLGAGVADVGGLCILGTERHESRRIDNQLRGRSGRQGDAGESLFFVSMEDELMRLFGGDRLKGIMEKLKVPDDVPLENKMVSRSIEGAQKKVEGRNFDIRKHVLQYDDVMNKHRKIMYSRRQQLLERLAEYSSEDGDMESRRTRTPNTEPDSSRPLHDDALLAMDKEIEAMTSVHVQGLDPEKWDAQEIHETMTALHPVLGVEFSTQRVSEFKKKEDMQFALKNAVRDFYEKKCSEYDTGVVMQAERIITLRSIDTHWMSHIDDMAHLREQVAFAGFAQRDPLIEYQDQGFRRFEQLITNIDSTIVRTLLQAEFSQFTPQAFVERAEDSEVHDFDRDVRAREVEGIETNEEEIETKGLGAGSIRRTRTPNSPGAKIARGVPNTEKVGRNDPCPCGSGKKYKKCHGK